MSQCQRYKCEILASQTVQKPLSGVNMSVSVRGERENICKSECVCESKEFGLFSVINVAVSALK